MPGDEENANFIGSTRQSAPSASVRAILIVASLTWGGGLTARLRILHRRLFTLGKRAHDGNA